MKASLALTATILTISLPFSPLAGEPETSTIEIVLESASTTGKMGKHWKILGFDDPTCEADEKAKKLARKRRNKPLAPLRVRSNQPVTLAFLYIEADYAINRECSYTWTFTPEQGAHYKVALKVSPAVTCSIDLTTTDGVAVAYQTPVNSCAIGLYGKKIPNGERAAVTYQMTFY